MVSLREKYVADYEVLCALESIFRVAKKKVHLCGKILFYDKGGFPKIEPKVCTVPLLPIVSLQFRLRMLYLDFILAAQFMKA